MVHMYRCIPASYVICICTPNAFVCMHTRACICETHMYIETNLPISIDMQVHIRCIHQDLRTRSVYVRVSLCILVQRGISIHTSIYRSIYTYVHVCTHIYIYACMYVCIYTYMYAHIYTYVYIYIYMSCKCIQYAYMYIMYIFIRNHFQIRG